MEAGKIFLDKENPIQRRRAEVFYDSVINLTTKAAKPGRKRIQMSRLITENRLLRNINSRPRTSTNSAAAIYQQLNKKTNQIEALIKAGAAFNGIDDCHQAKPCHTSYFSKRSELTKTI